MTGREDGPRTRAPNRQVDRSPSPSADVCVIGAGVAGALVADKLADRGHSVVVLEAGERFPEPGDRFEIQERFLRPSHTFPEVWNVGGERDRFVSSGGEDYPLNHKRVKGVGGTTLHWGGMSPRLHPKDFEMRSRYGLASDWPLSYEDLRPYYATAERELGVAGDDDNPYAPPREDPYPLPAFPPSDSDERYAAACERLGVELHSLPQARNTLQYDDRPQCMGFGTCSPVCPIGAKYSGDAHVRSAESKDVRVVDHAPVQRIEHDETGSRVEAVVYATPDGSTHRQRADQFVVACGGVETPRLLLLSASDAHPDGLANSSGLVGRNFMDHPYVSTLALVDEPGNPEPIGYVTSQSQAFYDHDDPSPGSVQLTFRNVEPVELVDPSLRGGDDLPGDLLDPFLGDVWGDELLDVMRGDDGPTPMILDSPVEMLPHRSNRIALDEDVTDDHGNPVPDVSLDLHDHAQATLERATEIHEDVVDELGGEVTWTNLNDPVFGGHHMGTTRMGTDPETSVVDPRLRTHDLSNLSVVSSSTFVTGGALNPTLTIVALALRAVEHLHADL